jgi:hypothetical protein
MFVVGHESSTVTLGIEAEDLDRVRRRHGPVEEGSPLRITTEPPRISTATLGAMAAIRFINRAPSARMNEAWTRSRGALQRRGKEEAFLSAEVWSNRAGELGATRLPPGGLGPPPIAVRGGIELGESQHHPGQVPLRGPRSRSEELTRPAHFPVGVGRSFLIGLGVAPRMVLVFA